MSMHFLIDYLFHYNPNDGIWYGFRKEDSESYLNGDKRNSFKSKEIGDLIIDILLKIKANERNS